MSSMYFNVLKRSLTPLSGSKTGYSKVPEERKASVIIVIHNSKKVNPKITVAKNIQYLWIVLWVKEILNEMYE